MADWVNRCGGKRWRTLPNGLIEVEGEGTPAYQPGSAQFANLTRMWNNWGALFRSAAARYGIPVSWVLGIATTETGAWSNDPARQATIISYADAVGIMQVIPRFQSMTAAQLQDPSTNVATGARILSQHAKTFGAELPYMAAAYNAGSVYCDVGRNEWNFRADANYPRQALQYNNAALLYLNLSSSTLAWMVGGMTVTALGAVALLGWQRWRARS